MSVQKPSLGRRAGGVCLATTMLFILVCRPSVAQVAKQPISEAPQRQSVAGPIEYVGPDTYILLDAEGRPQPVLGMSYEEFVEAWKQSQQIEMTSASAPRYAIDQLEATGQVRDDHVEVQVRLDLQTFIDGPLRIPLGMSAAILRDEPNWEPRGDKGTAAATLARPRIEFDRELQGFVAAVPAGPPAAYRVTFAMLWPLTRDGNQTNLRLNFPQSLVSRLKVDVPTMLVEASVNDGAVLKRHATNENTSQLEVEGLAGELNLGWITADAMTNELATVLTATGQIGISIDGHSIRTDARLTVSSFGGEFDRFRVRLPPGAEMVQIPSSDSASGSPPYRLTLENRVGSSPDSERIVLVELAEKQAGPVEIVLATEQPLGLPGDMTAAQIAGFNVLGAVRQFGDVSIHVAEDLQLRWQAGPYLRQVDRAELAELLATRGATFAFQYDRQPWSLEVRVEARPLRVHVSPQYSLEVDSTEARLRAKLIYQVPGARVFEFQVLLNGWELTAEPIESNGLVDRDRIVVSRDGVLELPLAQTSSRRVEVSFLLRRDLEPEIRKLKLPLPMPRADTVTDAEFTVATGPGVELIVDFAQSRGFSPVPITAEFAGPLSHNGMPLMRFRAVLPDSELIAERILRPREVSADVATELAISRRGVTAEQAIEYLVRHQPLDRIALEIPPRWSIADSMVEIVPSAGGQSLAPEREREIQSLYIPFEDEFDTDESVARKLELRLPQPILARFLVRVRYWAPMPEGWIGEGLFDCPLPQPLDVQVTANRVRVVGNDFAATLNRVLESSSWVTLEDSTGYPQAAAAFTSSDRQSTIPLALHAPRRDFPQATAIQRVWIQTWRVGNAIQDRAAFRFETSNPLAVVEMPPQVPPEGVEVLLDGLPAEISTRDEGRISVQLPVALEVTSRTHTLELRYRRPASSGILAVERITPPQLVGSSALNEVYWHVVLPSGAHVVRPPEQLVAAARWQWLEMFFGRRPFKSQGDLETWAGASRHSAPSGGQSEYLYSGIGPVGTIELIVAPRWAIVLVASATVLAIVLSWLYIPFVRHPWIAVFMVALIAALAVAYPEPTLLLAQASVLGWIAATAATALKRRSAKSAIHLPTSAVGSTNLRLRPLSRPESVVAAAIPTATSTPSAALDTSGRER